jgi:pilus assembly protein CpaB
MKPKSMLLLVVAGGCGLVAAVAVVQHLAGSEPGPPPTIATSKVVVVVSDQQPGTQLTAEMLKIVEMPAASVPEGTFSDLAQVTGQSLRTPIFKGEPVLPGKLRSEKAVVVPRGMVLASIQIAEGASGLRGFVKPGDHVNVHWLPGRSDTFGSVVPLLQDVEVVAVGGKTETIETETARAPTGLGETYTMLLTEVQNLRLSAVIDKGKFVIALRSKDDTSSQQIDEEALDVLLGLKPGKKPIEPVAPTPPPAPEEYTVDYVRDGNVTTQKYLLSEQEKKEIETQKK